jgi:hypothetical protein
MPRTRNLLVLPLLIALLCMVTIANSVPSQDENGEFWKMIRTVQDILAGKNVEQSLKSVGKGAGLVYGAKQVDLRGVVTGEITTCALVDTSYHGIVVQGRTNQSEDMGFIVLKTQKADTTKVRFHTVVFIKDTTGHYIISVWHTGD